MTGVLPGVKAVRSAAAEAYRQQLVGTHAAVRRAVTARAIPVTGDADVVLNAVFVIATPDRVAELQQIPGVLAVRPMRAVRPAMNRATTLQNAPAAWTALGGQGNAGAGMNVGIIDYGIDQTHPALQDSSLSMPAGFPNCTDGPPEDCSSTTTKVIVALSYTRLVAADRIPPTADSRPVITPRAIAGATAPHRQRSRPTEGQMRSPSAVWRPRLARPGFRIPERERFSAGACFIQAVTMREGWHGWSISHQHHRHQRRVGYRRGLRSGRRSSATARDGV